MKYVYEVLVVLRFVLRQNFSKETTIQSLTDSTYAPYVGLGVDLLHYQFECWIGLGTESSTPAASTGLRLLICRPADLQISKKARWPTEMLRNTALATT